MKWAHRNERKVKAASLVDGTSDRRSQELSKVHRKTGQALELQKKGKPLILILHSSKKSKKESSIYKNSAHGILKLHSGVSEGGRDDEGVSSGMNSSDHNSNNDKMGTRRKEFQKSAISLGLFKSKEKHTLCTI